MPAKTTSNREIDSMPMGIGVASRKLSSLDTPLISNFQKSAARFRSSDLVSNKPMRLRRTLHHGVTSVSYAWLGALISDIVLSERQTPVLWEILVTNK